MSQVDELIRVGSRKSELALIQTKYVISCLQKLYPERKFEIHTMSTIGDRVLNISLPKIGEKSLFTKDLEDALRNARVDFVVHSLKDLPTSLPEGMAIGAVLEREDPRDALVLNEKYKGKTLDTLPKGCVIGTSSLRRTAQLRRLHPYLEICDIRGNLNTRLAKLDAVGSKYAGIVLAQAGLIRMGWEHRISQTLEPTDVLYAVGQGALAVECRSNDYGILAMLQSVMCLPTACQILTERSFLKTLGGGCSAPVAVNTKLKRAVNDKTSEQLNLEMLGAVWSLDGKTEIKEEAKCFIQFDKDNGNEVNLRAFKRRKVDHTVVDIKEDDGFINDYKNDNLNSLSALSGAGDTSEAIHVQNLIDIHGKLFQQCPFYAQHEKDNGNSLDGEKHFNHCPLKIPVGQDFMGKCPYVGDALTKADFINKLDKSKITSVENMIFSQRKVEDKMLGNTANPNNEAIMANIVEDEVTEQNEINVKRSSTIPALTTDKQSAHKKCPFLQKQEHVRIIDCDDGNPAQSKSPSNVPSNYEELFCGLYCHKCYSTDLFAKCQDLGIELAEKLIKNGALNVMKCAQQEIREGI